MEKTTCLFDELGRAVALFSGHADDVDAMVEARGSGFTQINLTNTAHAGKSISVMPNLADL